MSYTVTRNSSKHEKTVKGIQRTLLSEKRSPNKVQTKESRVGALFAADCIFPAHLIPHMTDKTSVTPVAPAVVAQLEITSSGSVRAVAAAAAEGGADMPTR